MNDDGEPSHRGDRSILLFFVMVVPLGVLVSVFVILAATCEDEGSFLTLLGGYLAPKVSSDTHTTRHTNPHCCCALGTCRIQTKQTKSSLMPPVAVLVVPAMAPKGPKKRAPTAAPMRGRA